MADAAPRPRLTPQERTSHRQAHELLRRMLEAAGLSQRDLEAQLIFLGIAVRYRQIENYGKPLPGRPDETNRAFPPDWTLLRGIVQVLLTTARRQRPAPALVVSFLKLLRFPHEEITNLLMDLSRAGLPPEATRELSYELARQFPEFAAEWGTASEEKVRRGQAQLRMLRDVDVLRQGQASLADISYLPVEAAPLFVGREQILSQLVRLVLAAPPPFRVALAGPAGIGKSRLAARFATGAGRYFLGGVFWINSADAITMRMQMIESGRLLRPNFDKLTPDVQLRIVQMYWENALPKLIIFDNCEEEALLRSWMPHGEGAYIILTSRRVGWSPALGVTVLPVDRLARRQSLALLSALSPEHADKQEDLEQIAATAADTPLLLQIAGNAMRERGLAEALQTMTGEEAATPLAEQAQFRRTFRLGYEALLIGRQAANLLPALIDRLTCFAPDIPVPSSLLAATFDEPIEPQVLARALQLLVDSGMAEGRQDAVWMHAVASAELGQLGNKAAAHPAVERALARLAADANNSIMLPNLRRIQPHLLRVAEAALGRSSALAAPLAFELGRLLYHSGSYSEAVVWYERAAMSRAQHDGPEHPEIVRTRRAIASIWIDEGKYAQARGLLEVVLAADQATYGDSDFRVAWDWNLIGETLREEQHDLGRARACYERSLAIFSAFIEPMPLFKAMVHNNLGALLHIGGDLPGAQQSYLQALDIYTALEQLDHGEALKVQHNIGEVLVDQGKHIQARNTLSELLDRSNAVRGFAHPDTVITQMVLARCLVALTDRAGARALLDEALHTRRSIFGDGSPQLAPILAALAELDRVS